MASDPTRRWRLSTIGDGVSHHPLHSAVAARPHIFGHGADVTLSDREQQRATGRYIPLFWRLMIPNAAVLLAACIVLVVEPANGRVVALAGGLTVMLVTNVVLMRHAFAPLVRLTTVMKQIDPLKPGRRIPPLGPQSEVTTLARAVNEMLDRVEDERRESARRVSADQETERRHMAAELHDEIGQNLTALIMQLDRLAKRVPSACREEVEEAAVTARRSLDEVRGLARRLRPEVLDELGLVPALGNLCDRMSQRTGLTIVRRLPTRPPAIGDDAELVVYRVTQESLTNVVRHAQATHAEVSLEELDGHVELSISDNGVGCSVVGDEEGGMRGMRERAILVGGDLEVEEVVPSGTRVRLRLPRGGQAG